MTGLFHGYGTGSSILIGRLNYGVTPRFQSTSSVYDPRSVESVTVGEACPSSLALFVCASFAYRHTPNAESRREWI
jgi:hypothetical protein